MLALRVRRIECPRKAGLRRWHHSCTSDLNKVYGPASLSNILSDKSLRPKALLPRPLSLLSFSGASYISYTKKGLKPTTGYGNSFIVGFQLCYIYLLPCMIIYNINCISDLEVNLGKE